MVSHFVAMPRRSIFIYHTAVFPMRWFTCTPVPFGGGPDFFARDSGLLCRGFREIGVESMAVMPGVRQPDDEDDLIRTEYANLESAEWWRAHKLDGVVLYAWGRPRYRFIAKAIHEAGIFLVLNQDHGGLVSPLAGPWGWLQDQWNLAGGVIPFAKQVIKGLTYGLFITDPLRAEHLRYGDVIACVSPVAANFFARLCRLYGGKTMTDQIEVIPHGVDHRFCYVEEPKKKQLVCVGRWDDEIQKRPSFLMGVLQNVLASEPNLTVVIAGATTPAMRDWHQSLPADLHNRVTIQGKILPHQLVEWFQQSQVFYSPSAFESFGIAAAESLCCGCSIVAANSVSLSAFRWFVSENSGTLAIADRVPDHVKALQSELRNWEQGKRDAGKIAEIWRERLIAARVAEKVLNLFGDRRGDFEC